MGERGPSPIGATLRSAALPVLGLVVWALLTRGALAGAPPTLRLALAFGVLVLMPGAAIVSLVAKPPGGAWLSPMWALGAGVLWNVALGSTLGFRLLPLCETEHVWPIATAALWLISLAVHTRRSLEAPTDTLASHRLAATAVLLAALFAFVHVLQLGTPIHYYSDSPDHIGTVRRIMESGQPFPTDAFFRDAGRFGVDPRKGWWHVQVALIARLARVDALVAWVRLSAFIAPLFVLNAATLGWLLAGPAGAAATAWALCLAWAGNAAWWPLRKAVFSTFLADQLALAATVAVLWDLESRRRSTRIAAVLLALAAVQVHVFSMLQFALVFGALAVGLLIQEKGVGLRTRRLFATAGVIAVTCGITLLFRGHALAPPTNIIHTEPQGLLLLGGSLRVVSIGVLWDWLGALWLLFPLCWFALWKRSGDSPAVLYLFTTSVGVALVMFDPLAVHWLQPTLGYLLMRFIWIVPLAGLIGWATVGLVRAASSGTPRTRSLAIAVLAGLLLLGWPTLKEAVSSVLAPQAIRAAEAEISPLAWREPLVWLDRNLPAGSVVLSDPATSYSIPMLTRDYVVTLADQHSSPDDSLALTRLLDARDALDPYAGWARTREVVARHGVNVIALNGRFREAVGFNYWAAGPAWFASARARLDREPAAFERVHDEGDFVIYRVHPEVLDTLSAPAPSRPYVVPFESGRFPIARRVGAESPALLRLTLVPRMAARGDTVRGIAEWRALGPLPAGSYHVPVRFDRVLPGGFEPPPLFAKPIRKLIEHLNHERYRFRAEHLPTNGAYGVDLWTPEEVVLDSFSLVVPRDVALGTYRVEIKAFRQPVYPNYRLSDYFLDDDYYAGLPAGSLVVTGRPSGHDASRRP